MKCSECWKGRPLLIKDIHSYCKPSHQPWKIFQREELNIKILKSLDRSWQPKVTAISKSKDLTTLTTTSLFGKLREHKLEMNRLNDQEHEEKHVRGIALKVVGHRDGQESSEEIDGETLNLFTRKFSKFLKKNNNKNQSSNRYNVDFSRQVYRINCNIVLFKVRMSNPQGTILTKMFCYKTH